MPSIGVGVTTLSSLRALPASTRLDDRLDQAPRAHRQRASERPPGRRRRGGPTRRSDRAQGPAARHPGRAARRRPRSSTAGVIAPGPARHRRSPASEAVRRRSARVPVDGRPHTVTSAGLGDYRAGRHEHGRTATVVVTGLPLAGRPARCDRLVLIEVGGLAVLGAAGRRAGRQRADPASRCARCDRVAATAGRVAELPLHRGRGRRSPSGCRPSTPTRAPRSARSAPR